MRIHIYQNLLVWILILTLINYAGSRVFKQLRSKRTVLSPRINVNESEKIIKFSYIPLDNENLNNLDFDNDYEIRYIKKTPWYLINAINTKNKSKVFNVKEYTDYRITTLTSPL
ncbi:unnamed protein product [Gordionus sp. m RMFG-2023]